MIFLAKSRINFYESSFTEIPFAFFQKYLSFYKKIKIKTNEFF
jgi:hypothetical protein